MATKTSLLGLTKPAYTEAADIAVLNTNFDLIDRAVGQGARVQNLLDNSWFANPVAQAGKNGMHGSNKYVCDRWISWDKDATFANGYMTPGSPVDQRLDPNMISQAKTYTAAICLSDGTIKAASGTFASGIGSYALGVLCAGTTVPYVRINTGLTVRWAALYEGAYTAETLPAYVYKGYAAELAECQRYYENSWYPGNTHQQNQMQGFVANTNLDSYVWFKQNKRVTPTVTLLPSQPNTYSVWAYFNSVMKEASAQTVAMRCGQNGFMARLTAATGDTLAKGSSYAVEGHWEANADL